MDNVYFYYGITYSSKECLRAYSDSLTPWCRFCLTLPSRVCCIHSRFASISGLFFKFLLFTTRYLPDLPIKRELVVYHRSRSGIDRYMLHFVKKCILQHKEKPTATGQMKNGHGNSYTPYHYPGKATCRNRLRFAGGKGKPIFNRSKTKVDRPESTIQR